MAPDFSRLLARLDEEVAAGGLVSVWAGTLDGSPVFEFDSLKTHYAASTMKLPVVVAAWRRAVRGELALDQRVPVVNVFASAADGSPFSIDEADDQDPDTWAALGAEVTVAQLAEHAVIHSGNLATNLLLDVVGLDEVQQVLRRAGCSASTVVARGIEDLAARAAGISNVVTARDLAVLMAAIGRRDEALGGESVCGPVEAILARQVHRDQIPAGLPHGLTVANKTGWVTGLSHDVALVRPKDRAPFVLAVCTTTEHSEEAAAALVAAIARGYWEATGP